MSSNLSFAVYRDVSSHFVEALQQGKVFFKWASCDLLGYSDRRPTRVRDIVVQTLRTSKGDAQKPLNGLSFTILYTDPKKKDLMIRWLLQWPEIRRIVNNAFDSFNFEKSLTPLQVVAHQITAAKTAGLQEDVQALVRSRDYITEIIEAKKRLESGTVTVINNLIFGSVLVEGVCQLILEYTGPIRTPDANLPDESLLETMSPGLAQMHVNYGLFPLKPLISSSQRIPEDTQHVLRAGLVDFISMMTQEEFVSLEQYVKRNEYGIDVDNSNEIFKRVFEITLSNLMSKILGEQVPWVTNNLLPFLSKESFPLLTKAQFQALFPRELRGYDLPEHQIPWVTNQQVSSCKSCFVPKFNQEQFRHAYQLEDMTEQQVPWLNVSQARTCPSHFVSLLSSDQVEYFPKRRFNELTPEQLKHVSPDQIESFPIRKVLGLGLDLFKHFLMRVSDAYLKAFMDEFPRENEGENKYIRELKSFFDEIPPARISRIEDPKTIEALSRFAPEQLYHLPGRLIAHIDSYTKMSVKLPPRTFILPDERWHPTITQEQLDEFVATGGFNKLSGYHVLWEKLTVEQFLRLDNNTLRVRDWEDRFLERIPAEKIPYLKDKWEQKKAYRLQPQLSKPWRFKLDDFCFSCFEGFRFVVQCVVRPFSYCFGWLFGKR